MSSAPQRGVDWRALLARRGFRYFFAGMMISLFGSGMNFASVTWFILAQTGSTVDVSIMLIFATLPGTTIGATQSASRRCRMCSIPSFRIFSR